MCCEVNTANRQRQRKALFLASDIDKFGSPPRCLSKSYRSASIGPQTSKIVSSNLEPANPAIAETAQHRRLLCQLVRELKNGLCSAEQNSTERIWKKHCDAKCLFSDTKDRISENALWLDLFK